MIPNAAEPGGSHAGNRSLFDAPHPGQGAVRVVGVPSPRVTAAERKAGDASGARSAGEARRTRPSFQSFHCAFGAGRGCRQRKRTPSAASPTAAAEPGLYAASIPSATMSLWYIVCTEIDQASAQVGDDERGKRVLVDSAVDDTRCRR